MIVKNWAFALSMLSISTAMVAADQPSDVNHKKTNIPIGVTSQPTEVITPPVAPNVTHGADIFVSADFIYWYAQQDGLSYAFAGEFGNNTTNKKPSDSHVKQVDRKWEPGFKLGAGLEFEHDGWDLFAQWTWLNPITDNKSSASENLDNENYFVLPYDSKGIRNKAVGIAGISLITEEASWTLHYNVIDLELGRNFFLSRYMTLRPHIGLKTAWINQKFNQEFLSDDLAFTSAGQFPSLSDNAPFTFSGTGKKNQSLESWGLGIRMGIDPVFHLSRNWGIYGNLALSALYQYYKTSEKVSAYGIGTGINDLLQPIDFKLRNTKKSNHTLTPVLELGLGLEYMAWFYNESYMLEIKAGWEEQVWFNTNQFQDVSDQGNLTLQGFTFKAGLHF
ncbi:MAG: Lpg1974 family pore-forming outer membrane protein [Chlamydiae bacterium]|nr:Lpg1974 family pore-forming outer membrane protein [Chlamydiota bacterium]